MSDTLVPCCGVFGVFLYGGGGGGAGEGGGVILPGLAEYDEHVVPAYRCGDAHASSIEVVRVNVVLLFPRGVSLP